MPTKKADRKGNDRIAMGGSPDHPGDRVMSSAARKGPDIKEDETKNSGGDDCGDYFLNLIHL